MQSNVPEKNLILKMFSIWDAKMYTLTNLSSVVICSGLLVITCLYR